MPQGSPHIMSKSSPKAVSTRATKSGSATRRNSLSSAPSAIPNSVVPSRFPKGYGSDDNPRDRLLTLAGYSEEILAGLAKRALEKQVALLEATETKFFAFQGEVTDERERPALRVQLEAARSVVQVLGMQAPPAKQTVTVVHKLELPDWMQPDMNSGPEPETSPTIINTEGTVE